MLLNVCILPPTDTHTHTSMCILNDCLTDIIWWMVSSKLKFNVDKTDLIIIDTKQQQNTIFYFSVKIHHHQRPFGIYVLSLTVISAFASTFHKHENNGSIIYMNSVESGIISTTHFRRYYIPQNDFCQSPFIVTRNDLICCASELDF